MERCFAERLEREASKNWEAFYKMHQSGFFKDRHYLARELPELKQGCPTVLEVAPADFSYCLDLLYTIDA